MTVEKDVLKRIKPDAEEEKKVLAHIDAFLTDLKKRVPEATVELGGSAAKGTWLSANFDVDIFVKFPKGSEHISETLEKGLNGLDPVRFHGSRDYFQVSSDNIVFEIVPVIYIADAGEAENITDVSPLHAQWVKENADAKLKDEIRLTKQFFKANELYGAESYIKGFSGYVLEILTIYYGGFRKLLRGARTWEENDVIDLEKHHKDVFFEVNSSKLQSPLVVIDPVQAGRNAAAALSMEKFTRCKEAATKYLSNPSAEYFEKEVLDVNELQKEYCVLKAMPLEGKRDIIGCKLYKAYTYIGRRLAEEGFVLADQGWSWEESAYLYYKAETEKISEMHEIQGPPISVVEHAEKFREKYSEAKERNGRLYAIIKRNHTEFSHAIKAIIKEEYITEKVKRIALL